jgi:hypothetical protein
MSAYNGIPLDQEYKILFSLNYDSNHTYLNYESDTDLSNFNLNENISFQIDVDKIKETVNTSDLVKDGDSFKKNFYYSDVMDLIKDEVIDLPDNFYVSKNRIVRIFDKETGDLLFPEKKFEIPDIEEDSQNESIVDTIVTSCGITETILNSNDINSTSDIFDSAGEKTTSSNVTGNTGESDPNIWTSSFNGCTCRPYLHVDMCRISNNQLSSSHAVGVGLLLCKYIPITAIYLLPSLPGRTTVNGNISTNPYYNYAPNFIFERIWKEASDNSVNTIDQSIFGGFPDSISLEQAKTRAGYYGKFKYIMSSWTEDNSAISTSIAFYKDQWFWHGVVFTILIERDNV